MPIYLLGVDPGFANIGWALVKLEDDLDSKPILVDMGLVSTEKSSKKQKVLASDDNFRRAREISKHLSRLIFAPDKKLIAGICAESMSFPRNASAAGKVAMAWGVLADVCETRRICMLMASPKQVKKTVCGIGTASKEEVQTALQKQFGSKPEELLATHKIPNSSKEHPYDALASVLSCLDSEMITLIRRSGAPIAE